MLQSCILTILGEHMRLRYSHEKGGQPTRKL